ncbi:hypothetical protein MMC17_002274 [Xylographa soralifera]|nr:hypothetical protein [Xylographa soralifera]
MPAKGPVVIVGGGGGIAGLSLAQVLKAQNIPSIVLEQLGNISRIKDHGLGLRIWAYEPLSQRMGMHHSEFRARTAVDALTGGTGNIERPLLDGRTGDPMESAPKPAVTTEEDGYYQASYARVREILYQGLDIRLSHDVRELVPQARIVKVLCGHNMMNATLDSIKGPMAVVADGDFSNYSTMGYGHAQSSMVFSLTAITGRRIVPRSVYEVEIRPYMESSTIVSAAFDNWWLCTFLGRQTNNSVELRVTYSRLCQNAAEYYDFCPNLRNPKNKCPQKYGEELNRLGPFGPPFDITHKLQAIEQNTIHTWLMVSHRDFKQEFSTRIEGSTTIPAVAIGDAALLMPVLFGEGASHAVLDAVQLGDIIGNSYQQDLLQTVPRRFYDAAYYRWIAAITNWESRINSFHGSNNNFEPRWQPMNPRGSVLRDPLRECLAQPPNYSGTFAKNPEHLMLAEETRQRAIFLKSCIKIETISSRQNKKNRIMRRKSRAGPGLWHSLVGKGCRHLKLSLKVGKD